MGQQLPYLPNGQNPYGQQQFPAAAPGAAASLPMLPGLSSAQAGGLGQAKPGLPNTPGIPGIDPRMMQQAQQSLANPNAGDSVSPFGNLFPGPKELGLGAVAGGATAYVFNQLDGPFDAIAKGLDKIPGCKKLADKADPYLKDKVQGKFWREVTVADAIVRPDDLKGKIPADVINKASKKAVDNMERRQLGSTLEKFQKRFTKGKKAELSQAYEKMLKDMEAHGHSVQPYNFMNGKPPQSLLISAHPTYKADLDNFTETMGNALAEANKKAKEAGKGKLAIKVKSDDPYRTFYNFVHQKGEQPNQELKTKALEEWKKIGQNVTGHDQGALNELNRQYHYVNSKLAQGKSGLTDKEINSYQKLRKELFHVKQRISGINKLYTPIYQSQAMQTAALSAEGVGPVGRTFRSFTNYLQRIFRGDTMGMGSGNKTGEAGAGLLSKISHHASPYIMPLVMGATIFGFSFQSAKNAQPGEKRQAFFHNLLGAQIFNFIGWEFGRKVLNSAGFGSKVFRGAAGKTLPLLRRVPFLGAITLGGFATEMTAMFVFGGLFQKVGEKISHAIFGKPSQASIDGKKPPAVPGQQFGSQNPGQNQNQNPNSPLSGAFNPTLMNQALNPAMKSAGLQPAASSGLPSAGGANSLGNAGLAKAPQAPQAPQSPNLPQFSLSPAQISQSKVANDYNTYYNKLKADKSLGQRPGDILDKLDKS